LLYCVVYLILLYRSGDHRDLHSFPTRRSSDLGETAIDLIVGHLTREPTPPSTHRADVPDDLEALLLSCLRKDPAQHPASATALRDRKSTRLNSSHLVISYAVFCLKKKSTSSCTTPRRNFSSFPVKRSCCCRNAPTW